MKRAPRSRQRHDLYAKYHDYDSEISDLLGECGIPRAMLLDLAQLHGIGPEVAEILRAKEAAGQYGLRGMNLSTLLARARGARRQSQILAQSELSRTTLNTLRYGQTKNLRTDTLVKSAHGFGLPLIVVFCAALREYGFLPAPGANRVPRKRTRLRKPE